MFPRIRSSLAGRAVAVLLAASLVSGCTAWKTSKQPPAQAVAARKEPPRVRVTTYDGRHVEMRKAVVSGDSLAGYASGAQAAAFDTLLGGQVKKASGSPVRVAVALAEIQKLEILQGDAVKTVLLVAGIGIVIAVLAVAVATVVNVVLLEEVAEGLGNTDPPTTSCPQVESWDGAAWQLDSGTYAGAFLEPLARTDVSVLAHAAPVDGRVHLRLVNPPGERDLVDALSLVAADHAPGATVVPGPDGSIYVAGAFAAPRTARDFRGADARARVVAADGRPWESSIAGRDPAAAADLRDGLELEFARPAGAERALLAVDGHNSGWTAVLMSRMVSACGPDADRWYAAMNADPARASALAAIIDADGALVASLWDGSDWVAAGRFASVGPEVQKCQGLVLDLAGIPGDAVRVRVESAPSFWIIDRVALAGVLDGPAAVHEVAATRATDRDGADVRAPLDAADGARLALSAGDTVHVEFVAPPVAAGAARTYLARATGWYRIAPVAGAAADSASLARLMTEPHAVARLSVERVNRLLAP